MVVRIVRWLLIFSCIFAIKANAVQTTVEPLQPDEAFSLSISFSKPNELTTTWHIAKGYYLYVNKLKVNFDPSTTFVSQAPAGEWKKHKILGHFLYYTGEVKQTLLLPQSFQESVLTVSFQGCAESGFCYPPMIKRFEVDPTTKTVTLLTQGKKTQSTWHSFKSLLTDQEGVRDILLQQRPGAMLFIFFVLGLLLAFTPCVLPMVPILASIIVGQKHAPGTRKAFFLAFTYVIGMALTYAVAGLVAASLGNSLQVWLQQPITIAVVSSVFILLALSLFGLYELRFSKRWHNRIATWSDKHEGGTYVGVFCMGILSTLIVSPCVTAPLVGVLIYIGQSGDLLFGASALFVMGLGMGVPLLLLGMSAGKWLPKGGAWMTAIKECFGIFMVAMAIWLLSRIISATTILLLYGFLLLGTALYIGVYLPRLIKFSKINRTLAVLVAMGGILFITQAFQEIMVVNVISAESKQFKIVNQQEELQSQLANAKLNHQLVLLDFFADWCDSCVVMDKQVFTNSQVKQELQYFVLLRVDLSKNTDEDRALLKHYNVIAPPTILFFDKKGNEMEQSRIVGEVNAEEFLTRLQQFKKDNCKVGDEIC